MISLFKHYPKLERAVPHVSLANLPTPVKRLETLGEELSLDNLYIKLDGLTGDYYGGNKVRKIEFLLGQALKEGRKEVLTFGGAGSNHATVTAIYAKKVGLRSISMLTPQLNAMYVRKNLLMSFVNGAELHLNDEADVVTSAQQQVEYHKQKTGIAPMVIPSGGSSPLGIVGFVNAAIELYDQVQEGLIPEPDLLYVPFGSMGTAVGLMLGLKAKGMKTKLVPIRACPELHTNIQGFLTLYDETNRNLNYLDSTFPILNITEEDINIRHEFYGGEYARMTPEDRDAIMLMKETENIKLDLTYTAKTLAAIVNDADSGKLDGKITLLWHTLNMANFDNVIKNVDYKFLPEIFHMYFENDIQVED